MTHTCCPACRLRLTRAAAAELETCPRCADPLVAVDAAQTLGHALWTPAPAPPAVAAGAVAAAVRVFPDAPAHP